AAGAVLNRHKVAKHFELTITDDAFRFSRNTAAIAAEAALDGFYVVRTNLRATTLDDAGTVRAYKSLAQVERAFRSLKGIDLRIRPLFHWLAARVRARVFVPARLSCGVAHAPQARANALRGRRSRRRRGVAREHRGPGATLAGGPVEADPRDHSGWAAGAQLPQPAC